MIEAEIYGMIFKANIDILLKAPPANISNIPNIPPVFWLNISSNAPGFIPGTGIYVAIL